MNVNKMPVIFIGHGSPMNAIEDNQYTKGWEKIAAQLPRPEGILAISAHWFTKGTRIMDEEHPKMIYDMYGFPKELYEVKYDAPGSPKLAHDTGAMLTKGAQVDNSWGFDHGTWSLLCRMFPKADIPVYQLSIDYKADPEDHLRMGKELRALRDQGVLIMGSGNVVHNLSKVDWSMVGGYSWAEEFDGYVKERILRGHFNGVVEYHRAGEAARLSFQTPEHYYPLLYVLGAATDADEVRVFNDSCTMGSLSMTSYLMG